jgi:hypothetical protein
MDTSTKYVSAIAAVLALGFTVLGTSVITDTNGYYCESRASAASCDKLTATRCYLGDKYFVCSEGWKPLASMIETNKVVSSSDVRVVANGGVYTCPVSDGVISTYTRCGKDNGQQGYLGELV